MMAQGDKVERAMEIVSQINEMIDFAENEREFVLAAKLEDVRVSMLTRFLDVP